MQVNSLTGYGALTPNLPAKTPAAQGTAFGNVLEQSIAKVDRLQHEAEAVSRQLALGEQKDIHQTMIAIEKADIGMNLMLQIRNKLVNAYQEIMNMPV